MIAACVLVGCGSHGVSPGVGDGPTRDAGGALRDSGEPLDSGGPPVGDAAWPDECAAGARLVYLITGDGDLYSFLPDSLTLARIGRLDCPTLSTPFDMAVTRNATALVVMVDGSLFSVDTSTAHCTPTSYVYAGSGYGLGGMAYVADPSSGEDVLYTSTREFPVNGDDCTCASMTEYDGGPPLCFPFGKGLARVSGSPPSITPIADYRNGLDQEILALTGTGDGRLFGYYNGSGIKCGSGYDPPPAGPQLVQIDTTSANTTNAVTITQVLVTGTNGSWAFSFWGGDFWFYSANGGNSQITRYRASTDRAFEVVVPDTGMNIVGAGVSSCAPLLSVR
jgi:hypothetical protein